jgi:threonine/homoserine/homoserine lactone efflux protein
MQPMKNPTWPKALAFIGFAIMGLSLAYYSTAIATAGVTARIIGSDRSGDWLSTGSAVLLVGIAAAAAFGFLALTNLRALTRRG